MSQFHRSQKRLKEKKREEKQARKAQKKAERRAGFLPGEESEAPLAEEGSEEPGGEVLERVEGGPADETPDGQEEQ